METIEIYKRPDGPKFASREQADEYLGILNRDIESIQQWQEYYKSSGLEGQVKLFAQKTQYLRKKKLLVEKGMLYPKITNEQMDVLSSVFNCCVPAEEFSAQSMPSEVVTAYIEAKEYKDAGVFSTIKVMYYDGDPILLAEDTRTGQRYLLARWGDGLKPWGWFMDNHLKQKRARIAPLRHTIPMFIASLFLIVSCILLPSPEAFDAIRPFLLSLGIGFSAISAWLLAAGSKAQKSYSRLLNKPIPSPFATAAP